MSVPIPAKASGSHFYRYSSAEHLEWLKEIILKHELYLPSLGQLNDPADGRPKLAALSEEQMIQFLLSGVVQRNPEWPFERLEHDAAVITQARIVNGQVVLLEWNASGIPCPWSALYISEERRGTFMACKPEEIGNVLKNDESLRDRIVRSLGNFTVGLLAISDDPEPLELAGTGTLVMIDGAHYILTARHVWEESLASADHVGITLKADVVHRHGIPSRDFVATGFPRPPEWNEWGPDMILLRIPAERVGVIEVYRSFWNFTRQVNVNATVLEVLVLMGTPAELGKITDAHADLQITGMFLGPENVQQVGGLDYLDYEIGRMAGLPRHFGGVSGGGVWRVWLFCSQETDEIDWKFSFHGVAFYQLGIGENPTTIRCHGPASVTAVIRTV